MRPMRECAEQGAVTFFLGATFQQLFFKILPGEVAILGDAILFSLGVFSFSLQESLLSLVGMREGSVTQDGTPPPPGLSWSSGCGLRETKKAFTGSLARGFVIRPGPSSGTVLYWLGKVTYLIFRFLIHKRSTPNTAMAGTHEKPSGTVPGA